MGVLTKRHDHSVLMDPAPPGFRGSIAGFADEVLSRFDTELQEGREPRGLWEALARMGLLGLVVPASQGGQGGSLSELVVASEEVARVSPTIGMLLGVATMAARTLSRYGSQHQQRQYLAPLIDGTAIPCWAFTEPSTGSDPRSIETTAAPTGLGYVVTGRKAFVTNSSRATFAILFARLEDRVEAFLVDTRHPGVSSGRREQLLGYAGCDTGELVLDSVPLPAESLIGHPGQGFDILLNIEAEAKVRSSGMLLGMASVALEEAVSYAGTRTHRGAPIGEKFQMIQWLLAECATRVEAIRRFAYFVSSIPEDHPSFRAEAAKVKLFAAQAAREAVDQAMQVHGAYGYSKDYRIERLYREIKLYEVAQGVSEIQRVIVARSLLSDE